MAVLLLTLAGATLVPIYLLWRLQRLRPVSIAFADTSSARLWQQLQDKQAVIKVTESLDDARTRHLDAGGDPWFDNGPRIFVHFGSDEGIGIPTVWIEQCGPGYLMEVAYAHRLAAVLLTVIERLRPVCALSMGRRRPTHPVILWARLLWSLDGPSWFVLRSLGL
jgi:hypothetical protein